MLSLQVDTHVHSVHSIHAYSTIIENAYQASQNNISCMAITDHFGPDFLHGTLFQSCVGITNMVCLPTHIHGVRILRGVEIDIIDPQGNLAFHNTFLPFSPQQSVGEKVLDSSHIVIASFHDLGQGVKDYTSNTEMFVRVLENPKVDILGHCDRFKGDFDLDMILDTAKKHGKIIELNNHSYDYGAKAQEKSTILAQKCAEKGVLVSVSSDAHHALAVGNFANLLPMLEEINFPEHLIITATEQRFLKYLAQKKKRLS